MNQTLTPTLILPSSIKGRRFSKGWIPISMGMIEEGAGMTKQKNPVVWRS